MIRIQDIIDCIESQVPRHLQDSWDNSGWQIGPLSETCSGVLLCLDLNPQVIGEARQQGCNLIIAHHPLIFKGLKRIDDTSLAGECALRAIEAGISVYAAHTSLDRAPLLGVSRRIADKLHWQVSGPLEDSEPGYGVRAETDRPTPLKEVLTHIKNVFGCQYIRHNAADLDRQVQRIAICSGSGAEFIAQAHARHADAYLTGDLKHHAFTEAPKGLILLDMGHYESEQCTKEIFFELISKKFPTFAVYFAKEDINPIQYF